MRVFTKLLSVCAGALLIASLVLAFLCADSIETPATMRLISASMDCLIASTAFFFFRLGISIAQRRRADA